MALLNPRAGGLAELERRRVSVEGVALCWLDDGDALERGARAIARMKPRCVVVVGGDGTLSRALTALARVRSPDGRPVLDEVPIALAPMGTMSTVARGLGVARAADPGAAIATARRLALGGHSERHVATIAIERDGVYDRVGLIVAGGLAPAFFELYDRAPDKGARAALRLTTRIVASALSGGPLAERVLSARRCTITVDGVVRSPSSMSLLVASTLRHVGLGFRPTYRASPERSRFHVVASSAPPVRLARAIPSMLLARGSSIFDTDALASRVEVELDSPHALIVDGDGLLGSRFVLTKGPRVRLIVP